MTHFGEKGFKIKMKSLLQEASSVQKAIDLAWEAAGKPQTFTVKVLDLGSKNFFGWSKTPAIVSIAFEPVTATSSRVFNQPQSGQRSQHSKFGAKESGRKVQGHHPAKYDGTTENLKSHEPKVRQPQKQHTSAEKGEGVVREVVAPEGWTQENVSDISSFLQEVLNLMGSTVAFTTLFEKQILTITFARPVVDDQESERMLYASLSYLFIQFLKKKYKKRFKGFRLMFAAQ